jgi:beta-N-acetylhexosaminidase
LCVGAAADALGEAERVNLAELSPGGVVLFSRNVSSPQGTGALVAALREAIGGDAPALVCVDQEGGRVARLRFAQTELPSMLALGAAGDGELAERAGGALAGELRRVGANLDFAPVLDLALEPRSTVVGTRSLGDDPVRVGALGSALVRGLQGGGVAAAPKHFPGHGATELDSHCALPVIPAGLATLQQRELVPFRAALAAGARAIMTAHVVVPALDSDRPATLSPRVLRELLRVELGFTGVCFTDCLEMDAIAHGVGTVPGALLALAAGADMLVLSHSLDVARVVRDRIVEAVRMNALPLRRLEEAAARVAALRTGFAAAATPYETPADGGATAREIARRALVVVRGDAQLDLERPATVISFEGLAADGIAGSSGAPASLSLALRRRRVRAESMRVPLSPDGAMRGMLVDVVRAQGERNVVLIARRAHLFEEQARALDALLEAAPAALAISALEPFDVPCLARARNVACSFGDEPANVEALAELLCGRTEATGTMPVALGAR